VANVSSEESVFFLVPPRNLSNEFCAGGAFVTGAALVTAGAFVIAAAMFVAGEALVVESSARTIAEKKTSSPSARMKTSRLMTTTCDDAPAAKDQVSSPTDRSCSFMEPSAME